MAYEADNGEGYVYVLEGIGSNWFKVGQSVDPFGRIPALQTGCPYKIRLRCCFWASDRKQLESYLHNACKEFRGYGEWFRADSEVIKRMVKAPWLAMDKDTQPPNVKLATACVERAFAELEEWCFQNVDFPPEQMMSLGMAVKKLQMIVEHNNSPKTPEREEPWLLKTRGTTGNTVAPTTRR
jgi:hypothetical protein